MNALAGINWGLIDPVNIGEQFQRGVEMGEKMRAREATRNALLDYSRGGDVVASQNALLPYAPDMAIKLGEFDRDRRKQSDTDNFSKAAGDYYRKSGEVDPADDEFARMVEIDPIAAMKIKSTRRDEALERLKAVDGAYDIAIQHLGSVADDNGYQRVLGAVSSRLEPLGVDIRSMVPPTYPGPDGIRQLLQSAMDAKDQLAAIHRSDKLEADIADDQADNTRADRVAGNLITTRNRNASTSERRASAAERRGNIRPGGAKRPTATGPNGEKVQWNGKAWVPAK